MNKKFAVLLAFAVLAAPYVAPRTTSRVLRQVALRAETLAERINAATPPVTNTEGQ